ncbi:MAG: hypothetical protein ACLFQM_02430 [Fidelibacterota bacterium]
MKPLLTVIKNELSAGKILTTVIINAQLALLTSGIILRGYQMTADLSVVKFMYPGLIIFISILYAILISFQQHDKLLNNHTERLNYRTAGISVSMLYWGQKISTIILAILSLFSVTLIFYLFSNLSFNVIYCLYFFLFVMVSLIMVIAIVALLKLFFRKNKYIEYHIYFILFMLLFCSGFMFQTGIFPESLYLVLDYTPFGIVFNGARKLLLNNEFSLIETLYVSLVTITLVPLNYYLYKRELGK